MAIEIEHKYLVKDDSYKELAMDRVHILQGYLSRDPERTVRVRTWNDKAFLTVKGKTINDTRQEYEYIIPYNDAVKMFELCQGEILDKIRYLVEYDGFIWEVDEFHGKKEGLTVAEIELKDSGSDYSIPPFLGEEVTGNPAYYNSNL